MGDWIKGRKAYHRPAGLQGTEILCARQFNGLVRVTLEEAPEHLCAPCELAHGSRTRARGQVTREEGYRVRTLRRAAGAAEVEVAARVEAQVGAVREENAALRAEVAALRAERALATGEARADAQRIAELEAELVRMRAADGAEVLRARLGKLQRSLIDAQGAVGDRARENAALREQNANLHDAVRELKEKIKTLGGAA